MEGGARLLIFPLCLTIFRLLDVLFSTDEQASLVLLLHHKNG
jgi:hypothetical protein